MPKPVSNEPRFESYALRASDADAAALAVRRLKGDWNLHALSEQLGEFEIVQIRGRRPSASTAWETARALARERGVLEAEPLFSCPGLQPDPAQLSALLAPHERPARLMRSRGGPDKPLPCAERDAQWSVHAVHADAAWSTSTGKGVIVGHPDTGYTRHPELWSDTHNPVLWRGGYDFVDHKPDPLDPLTEEYPGHGGATASVIMSPRRGPGSPFVAGIAPDAQIVPLRVSGSVIHFSFTNLRRAIHHVAGKVQVLSMSLGGPFPSRALRRDLEFAAEQGMVSLAAAGNYYPWVVFPARYAEVLAVAATNCERKPWQWSSNGPAVDCSAPGESVWRAHTRPPGRAPDYRVEPSSGSSYAVATAAGVCALWISRHGHDALVKRYGARLAAVFRKIVVESGCDAPKGWDRRNFGAGILHAGKVLAAPLPVSAASLPGGAPRGVMESAVEYFPSLEPDAVLGAITAGVPRSRRGGVQAAFVAAGDELLFQLGSNARLRAEIHARATASRRGRRRGEVASIGLDASPTFRRKFGM